MKRNNFSRRHQPTSAWVAVVAVFAAGVVSAGGASAQSLSKAPDRVAPPSKSEAIATLKATVRPGSGLEPNSLGEFSKDNVYTAITPCRIVDTRIAGGAFAANTLRTFDVDGASFSGQGGASGGCAIPFNVAASVAMTITVVNTTGSGYITAWGLGAQPLSSVLNYVTGSVIANTTIVPVVPGAGTDFTIFASAGTDIVIDVVGFFGAPVATALDCTSVASAVTTVPNNVYTAVDAVCPAGRTATGGGTFPTEGTLGRPNIWIDGSPTVSNGWRTWVDNQTGATRTIQTYAVCCRVPGR